MAIRPSVARRVARPTACTPCVTRTAPTMRLPSRTGTAVARMSSPERLARAALLERVAAERGAISGRLE